MCGVQWHTQLVLPVDQNHQISIWFRYNIIYLQEKKIYMVGLAAIVWAIWKLRNRMCFKKKLIQSPTEIVCYASVFLNYWAGLQKGSDKEALEEGATILQANAVAVHPQSDDDGRTNASHSMAMVEY